MFIIFGWPERKSGEQSLSTYCTGCQRDTVHKAFTQQSWFTLFFIPIFPIGAKHPHAICNICGRDAHDRSSTPGAPPRVVGQVPLLLVGDRASWPNKRCPACAEDILLDATTCRFCGRNFSAEEVAQAVQDHEAQMRAAASAVQQAELAKQQQRQLKRLQGRRTRRLIFGILLTWVGGGMVIGMVAMFFSSPSPGNTAEQQKIAAVTCGTLFGLVPLASGIALLLAARSAKQSHPARQDAQPTSTANPKSGIRLAGVSGKKSKVAAGVLAIVLGTYGGHQFYLGNTGSAVIRLVVSLVGILLIGIPTLVMAVIAIIEGIKYLTMSDESFDEAYVSNKKAWF